MDRMKTFLKYILWIVVFFIFSNFLINVGLNSNYRDIERKDETSQISIYQAQATKVNGRIRGNIKNSQPEELNGKYIRIDFYSKRDVYLGKKYIQIDNMEKNGIQSFELFFKLQDVKYYEVSITNQKEDGGEIEIIPKDWTRREIIVASLLTYLIFW